MLRTEDLTGDELAAISHRLELAFRRRPLLPLQSLQYRLGETGHPRVHPYALKRALGALARKTTTRGGRGLPNRPWEVAPFVFASGDLGKREVLELFREHEAHFDTLASCDWESGHTSFIDAVSDYVGSLGELERPAPAADSPLDSERLIRGTGRFYRLGPNGAGPEIRLWIIQQVDWLQPDDPHLWQALEACQKQHSRLLIIARCIDPTTFVLLKALGVRGLQFYNMWTPQLDRGRVAAAADHLGWFTVKGSHEAPAHRILGQLLGALKYLSQSSPELDVQMEISRASSAGLMTGSLPVTAALVEWAERSSLELPEAWINTIRRFQIWAGDTPLRVRSADTATRPVRPSSKGAERAQPLEKSGQAPTTEGGESVSAKRSTTISRVPVRGW
jgi:hypothetical protein